MPNKKYPVDFQRRVIDEFPDCPDLHEALKSGSDIVGRYLSDASTGGIRAEDIVNAFKNNEHEKVLEQAEKMLRIRDLWKEWRTLRL
ncbi:MAG: hypothetical protein WCT49_02490 [Candidatus Paceibacterota bacterium]|jgi:hypothetical protein|nr:hypothetical protein [Candidatus Paceibacterota bacterium]